MNANYIYDIFETCDREDLPDLTIALAHLQGSKPIPEGMTEDQINKFVGGHYEALVEAFKSRNREIFAAAVAAAVLEDQEREAERQAEAEG